MTTTERPQHVAPARRPMSRVLRAGGLGCAVAAPVAILLGALVAGAPGAWGAGIGIAVPVVFFSITAAVAVRAERVNPAMIGAWVLGTWLVKLIALLVLLAVLRGQDFYDRGALFVALLLGTAGYLVLEAVIVLRTRTPYVEPDRS